MGSKLWIRTETILLTAGLLLLGYFLGEVLLLVFAAMLLAVGLDGLVRAVARWVRPSRVGARGRCAQVWIAASL